MWLNKIERLSPAQRAALAAQIHAHCQSHFSGDAQLVAYVVTNGAATATDLRTHLSASLPAYMIPAHIVLLDELPHTPNGKVDRNALPDPVPMNSDRTSYAPDENDAAFDDFIAPRTNTEHAIAHVWRNLLGMDTLSVRDNFFELGGHSLLVTRAVAQLRETCGVPISVSAFFDNPTIETLATQIETLAAAQKLVDPAGNAQNDGWEEIEL
jgi:acyl carrier protein